MKTDRKNCDADIPGKYDKKQIKRMLGWMVYRTPTGLYGVSILGWVVLTVLAVAVMGVIFIIKSLTV